MKKINLVLIVVIIGLVSTLVVGANNKNWPNILDLQIRSFEGNVANLNLASMNASLAANNFQPLTSPFWGFSCGSYIKNAPHNKLNFGLYTGQLSKSSVKGVKKASLALQSMGLMINRDFLKQGVTFSPKLVLGVAAANLSLVHKASEEIYLEPREVVAKGLYLCGLVGFNLSYNINEIVGLTASADYMGGYKLLQAIKDLNSFTGYKFGLGFVLSLPI